MGVVEVVQQVSILTTHGELTELEEAEGVVRPRFLVLRPPVVLLTPVEVAAHSQEAERPVQEAQE